MRYRDATAFRQALEQRLNARAAGDGARLARDRKRVVFDRLLARLNATAPDRWLLKGGFALDLGAIASASPPSSPAASSRPFCSTSVCEPIRSPSPTR